ncbi:Lrp/AsnC family transcriptional regulator [Brevibacterium sediminis]|uniref:AsnC family transcriptional regulator n=1 Tax=Brevibacterium sediminis TaxID=1857024 RepID=A0A5C4X3K2_9MICO|nr:Lrp/AsnC ligand binding domain-containing protein [Brevibacterium sediminis]TNM55839.1 AsnC family transcriptional regulator [Brevibacterium sediminis]
MRNSHDLDHLDHAILRSLETNGRLSNVELAAEVGLTPAPCLRRVKRLELSGVIAGYRARINPQAVGRSFCVYTSVQVTMTSRDVVEQFEQTVASYDEVTEMRRVYGEVDYFLRVEVEDSNAYERFQAEKMYPLPGVHRMISYSTMKTVKSSV